MRITWRYLRHLGQLAAVPAVLGALLVPGVVDAQGQAKGEQQGSERPLVSGHLEPGQMQQRGASGSDGKPDPGGRTASEDQQALRLYGYTLQHQKASEALALVRTLLSPHGSIELRSEANELVIRDSLAALGRILPVLRSYDHPPLDLEIEVMLVKARSGVAAAEVGAADPIPSWLDQELRAVFRWRSFQMLAHSTLVSREGEDLQYSLGADYGVGFRLGTVVGGKRLRLYDVKVWKGKPAKRKELMRAHLNPTLSRPLTLILTRGQDQDDALMVVLVCRKRGSGAEKLAQPRAAGGGH